MAGASREAPAPSARRAGDAGRGPRPGSRPHLLHVGRQLAPGVVVPDVELHVDVHAAGSPGRGPRRPPRPDRRLPPAALGPSGEPADGRPAPHAAEGPGARMAGAPHSAARPRPRGTRAARRGGGRASAAPSFFLVSARRKWLWPASLPPAGAEGAGRPAGLLPRPLRFGERATQMVPQVTPSLPARFVPGCQSVDES